MILEIGVMNYNKTDNLHETFMIDDTEMARAQGSYPFRYTMNEHKKSRDGKETTYCVHMQVFPYDGEQIPYRILGTYDLSYEEGMKYLKSKASQYNTIVK